MDAKVTTDKWKGFGPIAREYDIIQIESDKGAYFKALHVMVHQMKSWIILHMKNCYVAK